MDCNQGNCVGCTNLAEKMIAEAIIRAVSPTCYKVMRLADFGMKQGLTFGQICAAFIAGFVIYKVFEG